METGAGGSSHRGWIYGHTGVDMFTQGVDIVTKGGSGYRQEVGGLWIWSGDSYGCIRLLHLPQMMDRFCHTGDRSCHKASQRSWAAVDGYYGYGQMVTQPHLITVSSHGYLAFGHMYINKFF